MKPTKTEKIIICLSILLLLNGCMSKFHGFEYNATSNADCAVKCEELMNEYFCWEAIPSYNSQYINGDKTKGVCSCYIRTCRK